MTDYDQVLTEIAEDVITDARETHGDDDAFDYYIVVNGVERFGPLYQALYRFANFEPIVPVSGATEEEIEARAAERKARAGALWHRVEPRLRVYESWCERSQWSGWSHAASESGMPLARRNPLRFGEATETKTRFPDWADIN